MEIPKSKPPEFKSSHLFLFLDTLVLPESREMFLPILDALESRKHREAAGYLLKHQEFLEKELGYPLKVDFKELMWEIHKNRRALRKRARIFKFRTEEKTVDE